jgi:hypothetical protein
MDRASWEEFANEYLDKTLGGISLGIINMHQTRKDIGFCWAIYDHLGLTTLADNCTKYLGDLHLSGEGVEQFKGVGKKIFKRGFELLGFVEGWDSGR